MSRIIAIDQGTSSSRTILYDAALTPLASAQLPITQSYPQGGWVEQDPEATLASVLETMRRVLRESATDPARIAGIGLTNQRETVVVWDARTGRSLHPAIVWQDRRTAADCAALDDAVRELVRARTGLVADPYFSATKLRWLLDHVPGLRAGAQRGEVLFGTMDSYLLWHLSGGRIHATDATNASRTMLYDIHKGRWSRTLCSLFDIPEAMLPQVRDSAADYGVTDAGLFGAAIPLRGVAGDQQAAALGQNCRVPGAIKATYGTGCFALLNTGAQPIRSTHRLLTTIACQLDGQVSYALEGSIFVAGAGVQWLRDGLGILDQVPRSQLLAEAADPAQRLVLVPAFVGLGAPWWDAECRGAVFGLTRGSGPAEFARAMLESIGFQTRDLLDAMIADLPETLRPGALRVDGGMAASDWTMQFLADILEMPVQRPGDTETTARGAAWLAGRQAGICPETVEAAQDRTFAPALDPEQGARLRRTWRAAVDAARAVPVC
ncbi:glycerol kinase GlpK [Pseudooceanicola sp. CBS1P-1]|uniref:Glycerol kinase GlpK n=1 Tax=Pseudooceanicola albus TaxID=2692189 RepID=A0A6L7G647_9RHOB|nr:MULTISPECIES: glycerol kinase GlpK [Pseudooceanicola]MBT9386186.1 glycerol kinase GlpK [Pseudooceanicola endophyticus]MXN19399.1 glycerol kinase GlpK [Pseudooceanicola albus]